MPRDEPRVGTLIRQSLFHRFGIKTLSFFLHSANYNLTAKQLSEVSALCQLINEKLYPAYLYIFWMDPKNHVELVRPWFAKVAVQ